MNNQQLDFSISDKEKRLRKLDRLNNAFRSLQLLVLSIVVVVNVLSLLRLNQIFESNKINDKIAAEHLTVAAKANRARLDVGLCISSVSPIVRTPKYVKSCYDQIEKQYNITVERFGDGIIVVE